MIDFILTLDDWMIALAVIYLLIGLNDAIEYRPTGSSTKIAKAIAVFSFFVLAWPLYYLFKGGSDE